MTRRHLLLGLLVLALTTALPLQGWALGTLARVTSVVVICSGSTVEAAPIDWRGERVAPVPLCPDCTPGTGAAPLPAVAGFWAPVPLVATEPAADAGSVRGATPALGRHRPRAPPV